MKQMRFKSKCKIDKVGITMDTLTGRGGDGAFCAVFKQDQHLCSFIRFFWSSSEEPEGAADLEYFQAGLLFLL